MNKAHLNNIIQTTHSFSCLPHFQILSFLKLSVFIKRFWSLLCKLSIRCIRTKWLIDLLDRSLWIGSRVHINSRADRYDHLHPPINRTRCNVERTKRAIDEPCRCFLLNCLSYGAGPLCISITIRLPAHLFEQWSALISALWVDWLCLSGPAFRLHESQSVKQIKMYVLETCKWLKCITLFPEGTTTFLETVCCFQAL